MNNAAFDNANASGAFSVTSGGASGMGYEGRNKKNLLFTSSSSNALYNGENLQPKALQILVCIKS